MIIISGIAGSGKTTQAKLLASSLGYKFFSMGELLRIYGDEQTQAKMLAGEVVGGEEIYPIVEAALSQYQADRQEIITDGFPRSVNEADWLIKKIKLGEVKFRLIIHLEIPESVALDRLLARGRRDDNKSAIQKRFEEHKKEEGRMLDLFRANNLPVVDVDGVGSVEEVAQRIKNKLNND